MEQHSVDLIGEKNKKLKEQVSRLLRSERLLYEAQSNLDQQLRRITLVNNFSLSISKAQSIEEILLASVELVASIFVVQAATVLFFDNTNKKLIAEIKKNQGTKSAFIHQELTYVNYKMLGVDKDFDILLAGSKDKYLLLDFVQDIFTRIFTTKVAFEPQSEVFYVLNEDKNSHFCYLFLFHTPPKNSVAYTERVPDLADVSFISLLSKHINSALESYIYQQQLVGFANQLENQVKLRTQELFESREKYRSIVDNTSDLIWQLDRSGRYIEINPKVKELLGYESEEFLGKSSVAFMSPGEMKLEQLFLDSLQQEPKPFTNRVNIFRHKDGRDVILERSGVPIFDEHGLFIGIRGISTDITARQKAELELAKYREHLEELVKERTAELEKTTEEMRSAKEAAELANRSKSIFLANVSHEIRTPMNAILGYSQLLMRDANLTDTQREFIDTINRSGDHLLALINDVLEMSKIEAGKIVVNNENFDLYLMLNDIVRMFSYRAEEKGLSFTLEKAQTLPHYLCGDIMKIRQVIINLIGNAIKFTENGGVAVNISCSPQEKAANKIMVNVVIRDTGPGILAQEFENIFNAFEKTQTSVVKGRGSGLGLTISRRYARLLGGDIKVFSEVGKGSVFTFTFSAEVATEAAMHLSLTVPSEEVIGLSPEIPPPKILIVDDNESNRAVLKILLKKISFQIQEASSGKEALRIFAEWQPALILMDLRMPEMDGIITTQKIRELSGGAKVKILMLTASALDDAKKKVLQSGADAFIRKPYKEKELLEEIRQHLNIEYIYQAATPIEPHDRIAGFSEESLKKIPPRLAIKMLEATEDGNMAMLRELITKQLTPIDAQLANYFAQLANNFDYDKITANLQKV